MKKLLLSLAALLTVCFSIQQADAISYEDALKQSKPFALLVYANWADDVNTAKQNLNSLQAKYGATYNFVFLDIASAETKSFNKRYQIYQNLPYTMLFKDNTGKITRFVPKDCTLNTSCISQKLDLFIN